ncbi:putative BUD22 family protein C4F10.06 [Amylocarpus encephaloides]|uniref:BUD22 family protein C4F10.06 n=1 Tax=Amylocarpus encephaloides TaxID=45428 RepID=A0A9P7YSX8_9HELO|nr:putative BUD22 family protein C4F10.06 [Amylocarpus encephaloides]
MKRINREIASLNKLKLEQLADNHLCKTICKVKRMRESEGLPEEAKEKGTKRDEVEGETPEDRAARLNVMSGLFLTDEVKVVLADQIRGLYMVMGIPMQDNKQGKGKVDATKKDPSDTSNSEPAPKKAIAVEKNYSGEVWEGLGSDTESDAERHNLTAGKQRRVEEDQGSDFDSEESFSRYNSMLGSSSSESDTEKEEAHSHPIRTKTKDLSLSLSPSPPPVSKAKSKASSKHNPQPVTKSTTFLPTLLGGYFSGDESSASDLDDEPAPVKKNRKGQAARRAIWEKKYGIGANHIKSGQDPVSRDDTNSRGRGRGGRLWDRERGGGREAFANRNGGGGNPFGTGENSMPVGAGKRGMGKKDDAGPLHPSWQAAKKVKELKKTVKFEGKKVTFD